MWVQVHRAHLKNWMKFGSAFWLARHSHSSLSAAIIVTPSLMLCIRIPSALEGDQRTGPSFLDNIGARAQHTVQNRIQSTVAAVVLLMSIARPPASLRRLAITALNTSAGIDVPPVPPRVDLDILRTPSPPLVQLHVVATAASRLG